MMVVPSCECGDLLLADRTQSFLLFPQSDELSFPFEIVDHLDAEAFFKVLFPGGIVWVGFSLDFDVSLNRDMCELKEMIFYEAFFGCHDSVEDPMVSFDGFEVSFLDPLFGLVGVSPFRPSPQGLKDGMADSGKRDFTDDMLVIVGPSSDDRVELNNQISRCRLFIGLDELAYLP